VPHSASGAPAASSSRTGQVAASGGGGSSRPPVPDPGQLGDAIGDALRGLGWSRPQDGVGRDAGGRRGASAPGQAWPRPWPRRRKWCGIR